MARCAWCGKEYTKKHNRQMYCSEDCKKYGYQEKANERKRKYRSRYKNGTDTYWGVGTGYLHSHMEQDFNMEHQVIQRELRRLKVKV